MHFSPSLSIWSALRHPTVRWLIPSFVVGTITVAMGAAVVYWSPDQESVAVELLIPIASGSALWIAVTQNSLLWRNMEVLVPRYPGIVRWMMIPHFVSFIMQSARLDLVYTSVAVAFVGLILAVLAILTAAVRMDLMFRGVLAPAAVSLEPNFEIKRKHPGVLTRVRWQFEVGDTQHIGCCRMACSNALDEWVAADFVTVLYLPNSPRKSLIFAGPTVSCMSLSDDPSRRLRTKLLWTGAVAACLLLVGAIPGAMTVRNAHRLMEFETLLAIKDDCAFRDAWVKANIESWLGDDFDADTLRFREQATDKVASCNKQQHIFDVLAISDDCRFAAIWKTITPYHLTVEHEQIAATRIENYEIEMRRQAELCSMSIDFLEMPQSRLCKTFP